MKLTSIRQNGKEIEVSEEEQRELLRLATGLTDKELDEIQFYENGGSDVEKVDDEKQSRFSITADDLQLSLTAEEKAKLVENEARASDGKWTSGGSSSASLKITNGYPVVSFDGESADSHFSDEEQEVIADEFSDIDELITGMAIGDEVDWDISNLPEEIQSKLDKMAKSLRSDLEHVNSGKPFKETDSDTYFRIHKGPMSKEDLHVNHSSKLWHDDGELKSTRKGISTTASIDDLVDYFTGSHENSLGRGAYFEGAYIVELRGKSSGDTAYEEQYGERLIHPSEIVKQSPVGDTDFISKVVSNARRKRSGEGIINYGPESDKLYRLVLDRGKIKHLDF